MADFKIAKIRYTWRGAWAALTPYTKDDVVSYGGKVYVCFVTSTSSAAFVTDLTASTPVWVLMFDGYTWRTNWTTSTLYNPGDLVRYYGIVYRCITSHTSSSLATTGIAGADSTSGLEANISNWEIVAETRYYCGSWTVNTRYHVDDIVKYGGTLYTCTTSHNSAATLALGLEANQSYWSVTYQQVEFIGNWNSGTIYRYGDIVKNGGDIWFCITPHQSTTFTNETANWSVYIEGLQFKNAVWSSQVAYILGDTVDYGGYTYRALTTSTNQPPSTSPTYWQPATENYRFRNDWSSVTQYLVGDTVRLNGYVYLCIADNLNQTPPNLTFWSAIAPGSYWKGVWTTGSSYVLGDLVAWASTTYECKLAHTSSTGNLPSTDVSAATTGVGTYWKIYVAGSLLNALAVPGDITWYNNGAKSRLPVGTNGQILKVSGSNLVWGSFTAVAKVYFVAPNGIDVPSNGTTLAAPWATIKYACTQVVGPATIFIKTGTYAEILPISIPANVALVGDELRSTVVTPATGYSTNNMFYVRNGSGIRNMTLSGLTGTLGSPNQYGTSRPTAGAYVSLDPGAGTSDTAVQITTKSPYVQNVTTFGTGCVGMKVDGSLHGSGNKSIVANDFTQVLSDGIGAWINADGRAELVSVFTYYCHIGYLAENGGKIRATNGNNSYGTYGSVSEGVLATETPVTALVNNRSQQATIANVFTDGNQILVFEYLNAGQNYTAPVFNIIGTGSGQVISAPGLRNNAIFEIRVTDPSNSGIPGGFGYLTVQNYAQSGTTSSITFSANDTNQQSNYLGMRVVIISGHGAGQFGYIQAYNSTTKVATIYQDSTSSAGWDHVVPGTTIVPPDTTSQYLIEPTVTVSAPQTGTRAVVRAVVVSQRIGYFKIIEPGTGYTATPTLTITDPNASTAVSYTVRTNNGVLATPSFSNRGINYISASATVTGDGFQDSYQVGNYLYVKSLTYVPTPGANVAITGITGVNYRLVAIDSVTGSGTNYSARIRILPALTTYNSPNDGTGVSLRIFYSQNRLTGHDFLNIGFGNIINSNYPGLPINGYGLAPNQLAVEGGGGRVFYTSTDQDGNFAVGTLFAVQQASGVVTLNADQFNLTGLTQLSLGSIQAGSSGAIINQISTDALFTANSDQIMSTQKAVKTYINSRIGGGAAIVQVNSLTAGQMLVQADTNLSTPLAGLITNTGNLQINMAQKVYFPGTAGVGGDGYMLALTMFLTKVMSQSY